MFGLDAKFWGVVVMGAAIAILFVLPWLDRSPVRSIRYKGNLSKIMLVFFGIAFVMLGVLGALPSTPMRTALAQFGTAIYFVLPCNALVHPLGVDETRSSKGDEMKLISTLVLLFASSIVAVTGGPGYPLEYIEPDYSESIVATRAWYLHPLLHGMSLIEFQRYERTATDSV